MSPTRLAMHAEEGERSPRNKDHVDVRRQQEYDAYDPPRRRRDSLTDNRDNSRTPLLPRKQHDTAVLQVDRVRNDYLIAT